MVWLLLWSVCFGRDRELDMDVWTSRDGLPQNTVTDLLQDADGYIWVTTFGGIAKFDGVRFTVFDPAHTPSLERTRFTAVEQTRAGELWFGTQTHGLVSFDGVQFHTHEASGVGGVQSLLVDSTDRIWVGSARGLFQWDGELSQVSTESVFSLTERADGSIWAGGAKLSCVVGPCDPTLDGVNARSFLDLPTGEVVLGVGVGFAQLGDPDFTNVPVWGQTPPVLWKGSPWGLIDDSLHRLVGEPLAFPLGMKSRAYFVDREDGLWIGLHGGGLARIRYIGVRFVAPGTFAVRSDPDGNVVVSGCKGEGNTGEPNVGVPPSLRHRGCVTPTWVDGNLWSLVPEPEGKGLYLHRSDGELVLMRRVADHAGLMGAWFAEEGRISRIVGERLLPTAVAVPQRVTLIRALADGSIWARQGPAGLLHVGVDGEVLRSVELGGEVVVRDVLPRSDGLWVATYGGGLRWVGDDGRQRVLTQADGLCDNAVSRLIATGDGSIWMNTNAGAGRVREANLEQVVAGTRMGVQCEQVDSGEANHSEGLFLNGELILPTINGTVAFEPARALVEAVAPLVSVEDAMCGDVNLMNTPEVQGPCTLRLAFTGVSFDDPTRLAFRHRLRGHSELWSPVSTDRTLSYVDVPPGDYVFEVQARNARGLVSDVVRIPFVRRAEWWETWLGGWLLPITITSTVLGALLVGLRATARQNRELRAEVDQRRRAEEQLVQQQREKENALSALERARRLEAMGRLAGGVAHDFNNLLMVILGRMEGLKLSGDAQVSESAQVVVDTVASASALTNQLLAIGRQKGQAPESVDLGLCAQSIRPVLERLCEPAMLELEVESGLMVAVRPSRFQQLVSNLTVNARDASQPGQTVWVRVVRSGDAAMVAVLDTGCGMEESVRARMFEPYFTTKPLGRGTGLGMSTVHSVVEEAGGRVRVESAAGQGTRVEVLLPLDGSRQVGPQRLDDVQILLVDDQQAVLHTVATQLRGVGATVTTARSGLEALENPGKPDVVVTDVLMPDLSGPELVRILRSRGLDAPVVYISGFTGDNADLGDAPLVLKPFTLAALVTVVREAVD